VSSPARYLLGAQVGFVAFLALCVVINPTGLEHNHGWSYYIGRSETVAPYVLAFVVFVVVTLYAAALLERSSAPAAFATGLRYLCVFLVLDLATPDTVNAFFYWAHDLTSAALFVYELAFGAWLLAVVVRTRLAACLLAAQFVSGLVAMFSQLQLIPLLGEGILFFQLSFGLLLVVAAAPVEVFERASLEEVRATAEQ
jgi:hypothetical protein